MKIRSLTYVTSQLCKQKQTKKRIFFIAFSWLNNDTVSIKEVFSDVADWCSSWPHRSVPYDIWLLEPTVANWSCYTEEKTISCHCFLHPDPSLKVSWDGSSHPWQLPGLSPPPRTLRQTHTLPPPACITMRTHIRMQSLPQEIENRCLNVKLKWDSRAASPCQPLSLPPPPPHLQNINEMKT